MLKLAGELVELAIHAIIRAKPKCTKSFFLMIYGPALWKHHIHNVSTMRKLHLSSHTKHTNYHLELGNSVHCITAEGLSEWCYCSSEGTNRVNSLWGGGSCASISHLYCIFLSSLQTPQINLPSEGDSCKCGIWCALPAFPPSLDNLSERDWCKPFAQPQTLQGHHMGGLDKTLWYFYSFIPNQLTVNP